MWGKIWNPSNRKVLILNIVSALVLNLFLEWTERRTFTDLAIFMQERTFVFLYNALIIFMTLSIVFIVKKKYFSFGLICMLWAIVGIVNGVILSHRNTPFTVVDLTIVKSTIPVVTSYLVPWQILLLVIAIIALIAGMVTLYLYCPVAKKSFDVKTNTVMVLIFLAVFGVATYFGVGKGQLISKFDNLIAGYKDYGVAYGFCVTSMDTGIDRPFDYSRNRVKKVKKLMDQRLKKVVKKDPKGSREPNIVFIQLESFFDLTDVKGIRLSEDPLPNLHRIQKETTSGYVTVPVYGAGTINTEFEMITGMNLSYFGTGEYPYRSILHKKTCDSMAYWMKELGYTSSVIHNNNASFYDRDYVFTNLGFDRFITSENMDIRDYNKAGWAKDAILTDYIFDVMNKTKEKDYIYTISVQGHGDYPSNIKVGEGIVVDHADWSEKQKNMVSYYANEIHEMDAFLGQLTDRMAKYPEDIVLVIYGDHLPGLGFDSDQLKSGSKYKTPYFIWDNFGYHAKMNIKTSGNVKAYQMPSKVLQSLGMHQGVMNEYHQTMQKSQNYKKNMRLIQYDMLYGSDFIREGEDPLEATSLKFTVDDVKIMKIKKDGDDIYVVGKNFTNFSKVYVNGKLVPTTYMSQFSLIVPNTLIKDGDEIVVHQVSKTNENITLNESEPFVVNEEEIIPLFQGS